MIPNSFMSRANSIVIHGSKLDLAMQLILTPLILQLMERKSARYERSSSRFIAASRRFACGDGQRDPLLAIDAVEKAKSGHPGMPMGMADVATVLFTRFLKFDPADPPGPTATASCCRPAMARCCSMRCCI